MVTPSQPSANAALAPVPVITGEAELEDAVLMRFMQDLANGIHDYPAIATRYGFPDQKAMFDYLVAHPAVRATVQKYKALNDSDGGAEGRVRLKALYATEMAIASMAAIAVDPRTPIGQRIDAFKQLSRVGAVDGQPAVAAKGAGGQGGGNAFTVNFHFSGGRTETLTTTVVPEQIEAQP